MVIIATAHTKVDYDLVQAQARFIFDPKNAMCCKIVAIYRSVEH